MLDFLRKHREARLQRQEAVRRLAEEQEEKARQKREQARQEKHDLYDRSRQWMRLVEFDGEFDLGIALEKGRSRNWKVIGFATILGDSNVIFDTSSQINNPKCAVLWRDLEIGEVIKAGDRILDPGGMTWNIWSETDRANTTVTLHTRLVQRMMYPSHD